MRKREGGKEKSLRHFLFIFHHGQDRLQLKRDRGGRTGQRRKEKGGKGGKEKRRQTPFTYRLPFTFSVPREEKKTERGEPKGGEGGEREDVVFYLHL